MKREHLLLLKGKIEEIEEKIADLKGSNISGDKCI